jgi:hypothetical protein
VSEQSSAVVMFRALVMLVCLVAIPLAALFGSSLPAVVKAFQAGRLPTLAELKGTPSPAANIPSEAPPFVPQGTATPINSTSSVMIPGAPNTQPAALNPPPLASRWPGSNPNPSASGVVPAGYVESPGSNGFAGGTAQTGPRLSPAPPGGPNLAPVRGTEPSVPGSAPNGSTTSVASPSDPYSRMLDRLRQLGATYYLLECWGDQKREYRFYCRMAIGGNSQYWRPFWAIDTDPIRAMTQVLQQVESWRVGNRP